LWLRNSCLIKIEFFIENAAFSAAFFYTPLFVSQLSSCSLFFLGYLYHISERIATKHPDIFRNHTFFLHISEIIRNFAVNFKLL